MFLSMGHELPHSAPHALGVEMAAQGLSAHIDSGVCLPDDPTHGDEAMDLPLKANVLRLNTRI
jgi:hypothetical protein